MRLITILSIMLTLSCITNTWAELSDIKKKQLESEEYTIKQAVPSANGTRETTIDSVNDPELLYQIGKSYLKEVKFEKAIIWLSKAAAQGHKKAQFNLGVMYARGYGVTQDYKRAAQWYRKAAEQGHKRAQFNLEVMYDNGDGVAGGSELRSQKQEQIPSKKATELSCNLLPTGSSSNFPSIKMARAIQKCKYKAPDAQVIYDPGWTCYIWSISGSDANKMKQCLIENFGWKELGPPGWIENTVAAPPF